MKIIRLTTLFFLLSLVACSSEAPSDLNNDTIAKDVSTEEFKELIKSPGVILDVRTPGECQNGMIEGAINIDYMESDFESNVLKMDKNVPVYVYCAAGGRSSNAMNDMSKWGFKEVYNLEGGYNAWK